ncbi:MAG: (Fe-S)-binding protein [Deltaproteobacteria bacterium]|nr:(Fe-S)-binding protein [Deltaproteobacteria bacterium]MBW2138781.1 (Fe-S)-binding protein [Deltaproteobacteria bacterium]
MESESQSNVFLCMQCGMCTGSCPISGRDKLNIRKLVRRKQLQQGAKEFDIWFCTSCGECLLRCPRDVKPLEVLINERSDAVEAGKIPLSIQKALESTFVQKNPWGRPQSKRSAWTEDLDFEVPHVRETRSKRLLFSCCIQAYDPRCMSIPVNVARILHSGGLEFGILGTEESCCGNEIRRMGEIGLFEELKEENVAKLKENGVQEIITLSPHCLTAMKNEYHEAEITVVHYTEVLADLIEKGAVSLSAPYRKKVIYHDPCFLGKQNKVFDPPRKILQAIEGLELLEFSWNRENSLCCEGGGGRMFYDAEDSGERNSEKRVREALRKGAEVLATSCPFCVMTLEDPASEKGIPVKEISEIVAEVMGETS